VKFNSLKFSKNTSEKQPPFQNLWGICFNGFDRERERERERDKWEIEK
jgi:hypothetical protein